MARGAAQPTRGRILFRCVEPFSIFHNGIPEVYGADREVFDDDPILRSHPAHFRPSAERVEAMTARPGEFRPIDIPIPTETQPVVATEAIPVVLDPEEVSDAQA